MADDAASLVVQMRIDQARFQREMSKVARDASRAADRVEKTFQAANNNAARSFGNVGTGAQRGFSQASRAAQSYSSKLDQISRKMDAMGGGRIGGGIGAAAGALAGGISVQAAQQLLDANTRIINSLKVAGLEGDNLTAVYARLANMAKANGASFETLAALYGRVTQSSKELGVTSEQTEEFVRRIAVGLRASGTDAGQASDGIRQLTQALASGLLRGDEFNSVMENLPVVAKAIAQGFGVTTGELRKMAEAGELDAKRVFDAFIKGSQDFDAQAAKTAPTIASAFENIRTQLIQTAGEFDKATGASRNLATFLSTDLVDAIKEVGSILTMTREGPLGEFHRAVSEAINSLLEGAAKLGQVTGLENIGKALGAKPYVPVDERQLSDAERQLQSLQSTIDATEQSLSQLANTTGSVGEIGTAFENVRAKMVLGAATVEDFNQLIEALRATGTDVGETYAQQFEKIRDKAVEAGQKVQSELAQKIVDLGQTFATELGQKAPELINTLASGFGTLLPLSIGKTVTALGEAGKALGNLQTVEQQLATFGTTPGTQLAPLGSLGGKLGDSFLTQAASDAIKTQPAAAKTFIRTRAVSSAAGAAAVDKLDDELAKRVAALLEQFPDVVVNEAFRTRAQQEALYAKLKPTGARVAAPGTSRHERGGAVDLSVARLSPERYAELKRQAQALGLDAPFSDDRGHFQMAGTRDRTGEGATRASTERAKTDYADWKRSQQEKIALLEREKIIRGDMSLTVNQQDAAIEAERLYQEGLNQAKQNNLTITTALTDEIRRQANASAEASLALADMTTAREKDAQRAKEQQQAIADFNEAMTGIAKTAFSGFVNDLRNGVSAGDAFSNMLDRVIDGLINMTIEAMFAKQAVGTGAATGGGLFGFIGKLFGIGMHKGGVVGRDATFMRPVPPSTFVGAKRYQRGGVAGLMPGEVPAILHRGEVVIPKNAVRSAGGAQVNAQTKIDINIDNAGARSEVTSSQGAAFAQLVDKQVQQIMVRESRPGGLLRQPRGVA